MHPKWMEPEDNASTHGTSGCIVLVIAILVILAMGGSFGMAVGVMILGGLAIGAYAMMKS